MSTAGKAAIVALLLLRAGFAHASEEDGYDLVQSAAPSLKAGAKAALSLSVVPRAGHRLMVDGPLLVRVTGDNLTPARSRYQREDAVDPRADVPRFELPLTAGKKGPARLEAACIFYLCKDTRCRPVETKVDWALTVL